MLLDPQVMLECMEAEKWLTVAGELNTENDSTKYLILRGSSWPRKLKRESKGRTGVEVGDSAWKTRLQKQSVHQQEGNWRHVLVVGNLTRFVRNSMEKRSEGIRRGIDWKVNRWKILTWIFCGLTYLSLLLFFMIHFCRYSELPTSTALPPYTFSQPHTILPYIITVI